MKKVLVILSLALLVSPVFGQITVTVSGPALVAPGLYQFVLNIEAATPVYDYDFSVTGDLNQVTPVPPAGVFTDVDQVAWNVQDSHVLLAPLAGDTIDTELESATSLDAAVTFGSPLPASVSFLFANLVVPQGSSVSWTLLSNEDGTGFSDSDSGVLTAPIPEPGAWVAIAGLGALGFVFWRRRQA